MDGVTEARAGTELGNLCELSKIRTNTPNKNNKNGKKTFYVFAKRDYIPLFSKSQLGLISFAK